MYLLTCTKAKLASADSGSCRNFILRCSFHNITDLLRNPDGVKCPAKLFHTPGYVSKILLLKLLRSNEMPKSHVMEQAFGGVFPPWTRVSASEFEQAKRARHIALRYKRNSAAKIRYVTPPRIKPIALFLGTFE